MTRRIVDPFKEKIINDAMKKEEEAVKQTASESPSNVDLKDLLEKSKLGLHREVTNLVRATASGLLSKDQSQALINYTSLLTKLVKEEDDDLKNLSEDQLKELLKLSKENG